MRQLTSTQWIEGARLTSAQCDRITFVLTEFRGAFGGMLERTTVRAVQHASTAFGRCPPSSDLDPEIRLSNLGGSLAVLPRVLTCA